MRKWYTNRLSILFAILIFTPLAGATGECRGFGLIETSTASVDSDPFSGSIFWKVRSPSGARGIVLGLFHSSDPQLLAKWDAFQTLAFSSDLYFSETELEPKALNQMAQAMRGDSATLRDLKGEALDALNHVLSARNLTRADLVGQNDWALFSNLSRPLDHGQTIDELLYAERQQLGKPIVPLQTMSELISDLQQFSYSAHVLRDTICGYDQAQAQAKTMTKDLLAGQWRALFQESQRWQSPDAQVSAAFEDQLVDRRNVEMARRMMDHLKNSQSTFLAAFGASHLPSAKGVLALLKAEGFTVEPLTLDEINAQARNVQSQVLEQKQERLHEYLKMLTQFSDYKNTPAGLEPKLKFLDPLSFYVLVCGGYSCPVQAFYDQNTIYLKTELLDRLASDDPQTTGLILQQLVHWAQEQTRNSSLAVWCGLWAVREIEANSVKASYLGSLNLPVPTFQLGPEPLECRR